MRRVEEALRVAGGGDRLMVDGRFDLATALAYAKELAPLQLRWFEEPGDPLDYHLNCALIEAYGGPVATGENLFSAIDTLNLVRFGGMRADCDVFQMDPGLSYGLTEYARMLQILESHGFDRAAAIPPGAPRRRARLRPRAEGGAGPPDPPAGRLRHSCSVRQEHAFAGGLGIE